MDNIIKNEKSALTESTSTINGTQTTYIRHTNDAYYVDYSIVGKNSKDDFKELYNSNLILSCDTECFSDYWSFIFKRIGDELNIDFSHIPQIRYNPLNKVYIFECFDDNDCKAFAKFYDGFILNNKTIMYFYNSDGYDKPMLNVLLNLVANKQTNILTKIRKMNDFIIKYRLNYDKFTKAYWKNFFTDKRNYIDEKELFEQFPNQVYKDFLREFKNCIRNRCTKRFDEIERKSIEKAKILDIQAIAGFSPTRTKSGHGTSLSLKQLQLVHLGQNQKFDFNKYSTMAEIKVAGKYDIFISYSENDAVSLEYMYYEYIESLIKDRFYMIKAIKSENLKDIDYNTDLIFTNKKPHTEVIVEILKLESQQTEFEIDYKDYIKTDITEFNEFVSFVNDNKDIKSDEVLKKKYIDKTGSATAQFELNGIHVRSGFGGAHGAQPEYKNYYGNLYDFDYRAQYPSTVLQYKHIFSNIINVDLYEAVYNLRQKYKKLMKEVKKDENKESFEEYNNIQKGLKLILNSTSGLINSEYDIPIANKVLGRFIILKCQSLLYNVCIRNKDLFAPNINTDGVYFEINDPDRIKKIMEEDYKVNGEGYYILEVDKIEWVIQNDVNNYIAKLKNDNDLRIKGSAFNSGIKQKFNTNSNIDVNVKNAIKLINNEEISIEPVYFKGMKNIDCDKPHYFTTKEKGTNPVNNLKYPVKLSVDENDIFVTEKQEKADIEVYKFFAQLTKNKIESFQTKITNNKYYEHIITADTDENNKTYKHNINRIKKLLDIDIKDIGYSGFMGGAKKYTFVHGNPINPLINYKKTEIRDSIESQGIVVHATDKLVIVDVDTFDKNTGAFKHGYPEKLVETLSKIDTYKTWNSATKDFKNFKLIFSNDVNQILDVDKEYKGFIEILDTAVIWTMEGLDMQYFDNNTPVANISDHADIFKGVLTVKHEDAKKHIEEKEEREKNHITESNDIVINTALNVLKKENIDIFNVVTDDRGIHIHTSCPYCNKNDTEHYRNNYSKVDAYVNINKDDGNYTVKVYSLSGSCKDDTSHKEYFKELDLKFQELLPSKEELYKIELFEDICKNIDRDRLKELDENLLIPNTLRIVGTGGHKTFQSARKLIENVFVKKIFHIHSTKENKHIADFEREVKKILGMVIINRTEIIDQYLENVNTGFAELGIHKLIATNGIKEETLVNLNGVATNHTYWYRNGHSSQPNKNMGKIIDYIQNKPHEIVIDEYESFKRKGVISIALNGYTYITTDKDGIETIKKAPSCLYPAKEAIVKELKMSPFDFATEHNNCEMIENNGIWKYSITKDGNKNLKTHIQNYATIKNKSLCDCGRRKPKPIKKDNYNFGYITVDKVIQYDIKEIPETNLIQHDFLKLIKEAKTTAIIRKIIKVGLIENDKEIDVDTWGEEINDLQELKSYGEELEKNKISFDSFKNQLKKEVGGELFVDNLQIYTHTTLNKLNGVKYYLTANTPKNVTIPINTDLAHKSSDHLKNIDVCIIKCLRGGDSKIINNLHLLKDRDFKSLAFTSLATNITELINNETDTSFVRIRGTISEDESGKTKTVSYNTDEKEDINDNIKETITLSYINGTESQGRNYAQAEMLLINCNVQVNINGRVDVDKNNNIVINSIEEETKDKLRQTNGRIFRGNQTYKSIICFGEESYIRELFNSYPKNFTIKFNVETYTKPIDDNKKLQKGLSDIINYYEYKLGYSEEQQHFNLDKRKLTNSNAKKYEEEEIYNYYRDKIIEHYKTHKKKLKDTEIILDIQNKFGISGRQFKRIKKKYK